MKNIINLPGSKSIINRILCMALYHDVDITIVNFNPCNDVLEMLGIYDELGKQYTLNGNTLSLHKQSRKKTDSLLSEYYNIKINESGTCLRFVLPYFAFNSKKPAKFFLGYQLSKRPIINLINSLNKIGANITHSPYFSPLNQYINDQNHALKCNIEIKKYKKKHLVELKVMSGKDFFLNNVNKTNDCLKTTKGSISNVRNKYDTISTITVNSEESSQFLSSVMMLASKHHIQYQVINNTASKSYIRMTEDILTLFGFFIGRSNEHHNDSSIAEMIPTFLIRKQKFKNSEKVKEKIKPDKIKITLDPDYSTATYYWLYSFLMQVPITIRKITNIYQPDYFFIDILKNVGFHFKEDDKWITLIDTTDIRDEILYIDMTLIPDQIITLSFLSLFFKKKSCITGCQTLVHKESDRLNGIIKNINLLGGIAEYREGWLEVFPLNRLPKKCILKTFNDHRFALTFLMLKKKYTYLKIDNPECIKKSVSYLPLL